IPPTGCAISARHPTIGLWLGGIPPFVAVVEYEGTLNQVFRQGNMRLVKDRSSVVRRQCFSRKTNRCQLNLFRNTGRPDDSSICSVCWPRFAVIISHVYVWSPQCELPAILRQDQIV